MNKLVAFDTDRIKDYVFATDTLKEICGASDRLDNLNRNTMPELMKKYDPSSRKIYAHGGAGLFVVDADCAEDVIRAVEYAYRTDSGGAASVTGASLELPSGFDVEHSNAQDIFTLLQLRLRKAKDQTLPSRAITSLPHLRPCDACAEAPAMFTQREFGRARLICQACQLRRAYSKYSLWERLLEIGALQGQLPEDFNKVGEMSRPSGYIGLLYADGNGMGRHIENRHTLEEIKRFAIEVDKILHHATCDAIRSHLQPVNGISPCIPLLLGGDDLIMVTRAQSAIKVAITLLRKFTERAEHSLSLPLSLSVGVVLAHSNFPFRVMLDIAESALKFAKREAVKRQLTDDRSLINFLTITSANHLDFKKYHSETLTYQRNPQEPRYFRTLRPYSPSDLGTLVDAAHQLSDAPRSRLQTLGECVFLEPNQSVLEGLTVLNRWSNGATEGYRADQVRTIKNLVHKSGTGTLLFPWNGNSDEWRTPILDLVELFEFVKEG